MIPWRAGRFVFENDRPLVMGILNITPDSFSDGGLYFFTKSALKQARHLIDQGVDILDIGAESTRPGAALVNMEDEWQRLSAVLTELVTWKIPLSIDTMKPAIMHRAAALGVDIINDVNAFQAPDALTILTEFPKLGAVVMHGQNESAHTQQTAFYNDVTGEVHYFLTQRLTHLLQAGVHMERVLVDPGFGFGKNLDHNVDLLRATAHFQSMAAGVLVGVSRKTMIGQLSAQPVPADRLAGSLAAALFAASQGARVLRVHDVRETIDALKVWNSLNQRQPMVQ